MKFITPTSPEKEVMAVFKDVLIQMSSVTKLKRRFNVSQKIKLKYLAPGFLQISSQGIKCN